MAFGLSLKFYRPSHPKTFKGLSGVDTLPECQDYVPSPGGQHQEEHVQVEHYQSGSDWSSF